MGKSLCLQEYNAYIYHKLFFVFFYICYKASQIMFHCFLPCLDLGKMVNLLSRICGSHFHHLQSSLPSPPIDPHPSISLGDCLAAISEQQFCLCSGSGRQKKSSLLILWSVTCLGLDFLITPFNPVEPRQTGVTSHLGEEGNDSVCKHVWVEQLIMEGIIWIVLI